MTASALAHSAATDATPPPDLNSAALALWLARSDRWEAAHDLCQEISGSAGSWIHAYLHREEGDAPNAAYWYARAGKPVPAASVTLADEWLELASALA